MPPQRAQESPFLRLPAEIRLQIYGLLLLPQRAKDLLPSLGIEHSSTKDYFDYETKQDCSANVSHPTLMIRTLDPDHYTQRYSPDKPAPIRSRYSVRCDRFRSACKSTTYLCLNASSRLQSSVAIMRSNKQIHFECADLLYSSSTFDFDTHVEAIVPFFSDLTPFARSSIRGVRVVKRALAYDKEFDRCEWSTALRYLTSPSTGLALRKLELGIVAGRPGDNGWDGVPTYSADYFRDCTIDGEEGMEWIRHLLQFKGLQELVVKAVVEHCPPATNSSAMAKYVRFSASVEEGFKEFLSSRLLDGGVAE
ncbi:hypothetical protein LTR62_007589 [Meristemomyces frigidus]|uniref:Uncharacterized protein n=1 Tax=Meristemomyces frigidus TaxID=1508187 RepID=A0AAN7TB09_9PEZI|nr:hypothetical protein LTR62_007589 [Meristemomyces frigidus]